jgi:molecular chaperone HtpG
MNRLIKKVEGNSVLLASIQNCEVQVTPILQGFITNFPEYTDHSINHSKAVLGYADHLLNTEVEKLNEDEAYILIMAGFLHDIGMCPTNEMKANVIESSAFKESGKKFEDYLRDIHHKVSYQYITTFWRELRIINETYAEAIALVGMGHRKVELLDFDTYNPEFVVKSGSEFVCLPYLAGVLRLADELDITNDRTPELLYNQYFPSNRISREEWVKHKANYFVSFNKPTIKITSKCFEKDLYYALLKQYNKIDGVIKYAQKIVYTIPQNERKLKIDFIKLEKDIKTIGFAPKEIGFTFDLQNTINTFIGENIYKNNFVAIRECLQNTIDTCRYRKQLSKDLYSPQINITLKEGELTISDNGLGMDEFIVENYFAKLAKSYYTENHVSKEFEAISQFGIGVFSYFLICDYFEVETKREDKPALKFRVTKNAENYFHFYDKVDKSSVGTTITFFLKIEVSFDELVEQVKHYIRFFEYPISIKYENRTELITSNTFDIDKLEMLGKGVMNESIKREYFETVQNLELIASQLNNGICEGKLGLLFSKNRLGIYSPIKDYDTFGTYDSSNIEVSQKGIFVGSLHRFGIKNLLGKINLKRKNDIDIGRYHIKNDPQIAAILKEFIEEILKKLFNNWKSLDLYERAELSTKLISNYFDDYGFYNVNLIENFHNELFFGVYTGEKIGYLSLSEISKFSKFVIVNDDSPFPRRYLYDYKTIGEIYAQLQLPLVLQNRGYVAKYLLEIFKSKNSKVEILVTQKHWFYKIEPESALTLEYNLLSRRYNAYPFNKPHLYAHLNLLADHAFNIDHPIVKYFSLHKSDILKNQKLFKAFEEFFKELSSFIYDLHSNREKTKDPMSETVYLNSILEEINRSQATSFALSEKDFPSWVNVLIGWKEINEVP